MEAEIQKLKSEMGDLYHQLMNKDALEQQFKEKEDKFKMDIQNLEKELKNISEDKSHLQQELKAAKLKNESTNQNTKVIENYKNTKAANDKEILTLKEKVRDLELRLLQHYQPTSSDVPKQPIQKGALKPVQNIINLQYKQILEERDNLKSLLNTKTQEFENEKVEITNSAKEAVEKIGLEMETMKRKYEIQFKEKTAELQKLEQKLLGIENRSATEKNELLVEVTKYKEISDKHEQAVTRTQTTLRKLNKEKEDQVKLLKEKETEIQEIQLKYLQLEKKN